MTDSKPKQTPPSPRPLPSFRNIITLNAARSKSNASRTMPTSISTPDFTALSRTKPTKPKKEERPPPKKERKDKRIEFSAIATPKRKNEDTFNTIMPKPKTDLFDTQLDDFIESEVNSAVTLPLVHSKNPIPEAADILNTPKEEKVVLVQLPSALPIQYPNDSAQMEYNPLFSAADGQIGSLYIHQSGKVTAKIGNIVLDVSSGIAPSCNEIMCLKREKGIDYFRIPGEKLKFSVDIDALLDSK